MTSFLDIWMPYQRLLPEAVLMSAVLVLLATHRHPTMQSYAHLIAIAALLLAQVILWNLSHTPSPTADGLFLFDTLSFFARSLILLGGALILFLPFENESLLEHKPLAVEHPSLILLASIGLMVMVSAYDLLTLYLGMELSSLSLAILAASMRRDAVSVTGGLVYFVLSAVASLFFLYGMALLYGFGGGTSFGELSQLAVAAQSGTDAIVIVASLFVLVAFAFKMAAAPFHFWVADVYQAAPTHVTAFFATIPKITVFILLVRLIFLPFQGFYDAITDILVLLACVSMLVGSLAAMAQNDIKRLLAYSSVAHIGFALVGLVAANKAGLNGALIYMLIYGMMTIGCFALILLIQRRSGSIGHVDDLAGLARSHPVIALALAIVMLSMAGLPPFAGFFAKLQVLLPLMQQGYEIVAFVFVVSAVIGCAYYLRVLKCIYFDEPHEDIFLLKNRETAFVIALVTAFLLFYGLFPMVFLDLAASSLAAYGRGLP